MATVQDPGSKKRRFARLRQLGMVFAMTRRADRRLVPYLVLAFAAPLAAFLVVGVLVDHPIYLGLLGVLTGVLVAMVVLARRAERAAFGAIADQKGAAGAALRNIRRGWFVEEQPVGVDPRTQDLVFRAVGRGGVVLVSEGPVPRVNRLVDAERKKVQRLVPGVPVTVLNAGDGEGQVPLRKVATRVTRIKPVLTKQQTAEVTKRLKALGGVRMPVPKGVDPMRARADRRAMRGR